MRTRTILARGAAIMAVASSGLALASPAWADATIQLDSGAPPPAVDCAAARASAGALDADLWIFTLVALPVAGTGSPVQPSTPAPPSPAASSSTPSGSAQSGPTPPSSAQSSSARTGTRTGTATAGTPANPPSPTLISVTASFVNPTGAPSTVTAAGSQGEALARVAAASTLINASADVAPPTEPAAVRLAAAECPADPLPRTTASWRGTGLWPTGNQGVTALTNPTSAPTQPSGATPTADPPKAAGATASPPAAIRGDRPDEVISAPFLAGTGNGPMGTVALGGVLVVACLLVLMARRIRLAFYASRPSQGRSRRRSSQTRRTGRWKGLTSWGRERTRQSAYPADFDDDPRQPTLVTWRE